MCYKPLLCLSSSETNGCSSPEVFDTNYGPQSDSSVLAKEARHISSIVSPDEGGSCHSGSYPAPSGRDPQANSVVSEEQLLRAQGFSQRVIKTLLNCHKPVTRAIYTKVWRRFNSWLAEQGLEQPGIPASQDCFQAGVELGLSISMLKVQAANSRIDLLKTSSMPSLGPGQ